MIFRNINLICNYCFYTQIFGIRRIGKERMVSTVDIKNHLCIVDLVLADISLEPRLDYQEKLA